jgi:hypothetical protein
VPSAFLAIAANSQKRAHVGIAFPAHVAQVDMTGVRMNTSESSNVTPLRIIFRLPGDIAYRQAQYTLPIYTTSIFRISREVYGLGNLSSLSKQTISAR